MHTIVFHSAALGDFVLTWPILRALPGQVFLVTARDKGRVARFWLRGGLLTFDGDRPEFSRLFAPTAEHEIKAPVRPLLADADRVISYVSSGTDAWAANVRELAPGADHLFIRQRPRSEDCAHVLQHQLNQLSAAGLELALVEVEPRRNIDGPVVIHPGSGGRDKCWLPERFEQLLEHFAAIGRPTTVLIGEAERERMVPGVLESWRRRFEVIEPTSLIEVSHRLMRAAVYIGNDSGPTHLAAQIGVPTIALFGPTDPRIWAPLGPQVTVIAPGEPREMTWLPVEAVIEAAAAHG